MKEFGNYECDGQMSLTDIYPESCCGVTPWLHKAKCWMDGRVDIPQLWMMYYICPICMKAPVDVCGWIIRSRGTFEEAKAKALENWNNPKIIHECHEREKLHITIAEREEWEQLYGDKVDYMGRKKE